MARRSQKQTSSEPSGQPASRQTNPSEKEFSETNPFQSPARPARLLRASPPRSAAPLLAAVHASLNSPTPYGRSPFPSNKTRKDGHSPAKNDGNSPARKDDRSPVRQPQKVARPPADASDDDSDYAPSHDSESTESESLSDISDNELLDIVHPHARQRRRLAAVAIAIVMTIPLMHWILFIHPSLAYCSAETPQKQPSWNPLIHITPSCIECPPHAICSDKSVTACEDDFVQSRSLLARIFANSPNPNFFFPLAEPSCVQDSLRLEKQARFQQRITVLSYILEDIVRSWIGNAECGNISRSKETQWAWSASHPSRIRGMPLAIAKSSIRSHVPKHWSESDFELHWQGILERIASNQPQSSSASSDPKTSLSTILDDATHQHRLLVSSRSAIHTLSCNVRRYVWRLATNYAHYLVFSGATVLMAILAYSAHIQRRTERRVVAIIVEDILDMVHSESDYHQQDPMRYPAPGLPLAQIREHLLPKTTPESVPPFLGGASSSGLASHGSGSSNSNDDIPYITTTDPHGHTIWHIADTHTRARLWSLVVSEIAKSSMVRKTTMEVRGQPQDLWMWVASHALSPRKMPSVRKPTVSGDRFNHFPQTPLPSSSSLLNASSDSHSRRRHQHSLGDDDENAHSANVPSGHTMHFDSKDASGQSNTPPVSRAPFKSSIF